MSISLVIVWNAMTGCADAEATENKITNTGNNTLAKDIK